MSSCQHSIFLRQLRFQYILLVRLQLLYWHAIHVAWLNIEFRIAYNISLSDIDIQGSSGSFLLPSRLENTGHFSEFPVTTNITTNHKEIWLVEIYLTFMRTSKNWWFSTIKTKKTKFEIKSTNVPGRETVLMCINSHWFIIFI